MKNSRATACIQMIDVERINILNPRVRNKKSVGAGFGARVSQRK